ncbi:hypothetical protein EVAR_7502_1 [Eumeta japonica]|uniref:Uncharacterized protein n=1 Tax=Eumeta variegata TaxID=151549 RepID=A0A4C1Y712_EUMVA|nr:hypothetical protein EVAR_7502_1 [Eumeta japonica]
MLQWSKINRVRELGRCGGLVGARRGVTGAPRTRHGRRAQLDERILKKQEIENKDRIRREGRKETRNILMNKRGVRHASIMGFRESTPHTIEYLLSSSSRGMLFPE